MLSWVNQLDWSTKAIKIILEKLIKALGYILNIKLINKNTIDLLYSRSMDFPRDEVLPGAGKTSTQKEGIKQDTDERWGVLFWMVT